MFEATRTDPMGPVSENPRGPMSPCPFQDDCLLFERTLAQQPAVSAVYRKLYCEEAVSACARLLVRRELGEAAVPPGLFPSETDKARALIRRG